MIIIGAKGFAKELLEVAHQLGRTDRLVFFDNVSTDLPDQLYGQFSILRTEEEVKAYFKENGNAFALGLGNPKLRKQLCELFESWGGELTSLISPKANIGSFGVEIGPGATILAQATITTDVKCGLGLLMYPNALLTHDCQVDDFVELSPGATLLGGVLIGSGAHIGANATVLPQLKIGSNAVVGAGAVVTKNVRDGETVKGIPAR
jgi:sugar O-acyltransferase (sialic acid O-acetyltransferase NeuD family)